MQDAARDGARRAPQGAGAPGTPGGPGQAGASPGSGSGGSSRTAGASPAAAAAAAAASPGTATARGPRALVLRRQEHQDFGFTLRHFIVYPPESYTILGGDRRMHHVAVDEPMDTIFVRLVRDHSPAHLAGLCQGDRVVSVNGETIGGKSYAQVVQLIQNSGPFLHLLVVPKEEDLLQQYFGETAHNPETNQRPQRMRSPDVREREQRDQRQGSPLSSRPVSGVSGASGASDFPSGWPPPAAAAPTAAEPLYDTVGRRSSESAAQRRELTANARTQFMMGGPAPVAASLVTSAGAASRVAGGVAWESLPPHCRLSLDAGMLDGGSLPGGLPGALPGSSGAPSADSSRRESSSSLPTAGSGTAGSGTAASSKDSLLSMDSTSTLQDGCSSDDSVILSRIRRSTEQKEEFLRRPAQPIWPLGDQQLLPQLLQQQQHKGVIAREFYARPQKLQKPVWPPPGSVEKDKEKEPSGAGEDLESGPGRGAAPNFVAGGPVGAAAAATSSPSAASAQARANKSYFSTLSRIQENQPSVSSTGSEDTVMNGDSTSLPSSCSSRGAEENPAHLAGIHLVSRRARQFEAGEEEDGTDRTSFYRSELARLSSKKGVPEVAVRKREYESRSLQDNSNARKIEKAGSPPSSNAPPSAVSGNRSIPIGSSKLHCDPPPDYKPAPEDLYYGPEPRSQSSSLKMRIRSRSADPTHRDQRSKTIRQDTYHSAVTSGSPRTIDTSAVVRRQKDPATVDEDRSTRRVSYLKATWNDRMHVDSDLELSDTEPTSTCPNVAQRSSASRTSSAVVGPGGTSPRSSPRTSVKDNNGQQQQQAPLHRDREGWLHCKITLIDGKRAPDRSWKQVWALVRGPMLCLYKERAHAPHSETPLGSEGAGDHIDLRCSLVEVAADYTKKKHVLRLNSASGSELLLQADTGADLLQWVRVLQDQAGDPADAPAAAAASGLSAPGQGLSPTVAHKGIKKLTALRNRSPTAPAATSSSSSSSGAVGQPPASKARKQSAPGAGGAGGVPLPQVLPQLPSPKSKTWKGRVAKQFRKMHQGGGGHSPSSPTAPQAQADGVAIGVPLEDCPPSTFSEAVPLLVELCTSIVEARGLEVIGIYRVPGNTAAVTSLTESINKGFDYVNLQDPRWGDVNVISSLLKSFFRRLPDSLFTTELYPSFIEADKIDSPLKRVNAIRKLIRELPEHHYETLKYLLAHLKRVVEHSHTNKMEARNLAIVFGPTLVRAGDDNMVTMVTDMSSQCRIVETLISNVDWFFSEDDSEEFPMPISEDTNTSLNLPSSEAVAAAAVGASSQNQSLLLGNIHKVEGLKAESPSKDVSARDIVSSIITAANRKIQRGKTKKSESEQDQKPMADIHRPKNKDHSSGFMSDPDSPPPAASLSHKRCSLTDPMRIHVEPQATMEVRSSNEPTVSSIPTSSIPTITTSSPKTSLALRYKSPQSDDVAIMSYANLAQTTQERIKRFEQETKAMLERDLYRQNRDSQQWDEQRKQIERQWLEAKQELEADDALDNVISSTSDKKLSGEKLRVDSVRSLLSSTSSSGSASGGATPPQRSSWRVGWGSRLSSTSNTSNSASSLVGGTPAAPATSLPEAQNNGHLKRMKTGKEPRSGSLDSLQGVPACERTHSHMSDEGGDLLATLTSTFDQKMKSLLGASKSNSAAAKIALTKTTKAPNGGPGTTSSTSKSNPTSNVLAATTPSASNDVKAVSNSTSTVPECLHLLNCDEDIPFADTDATELEPRGTQATSMTVNVLPQGQTVSPTALLSYRDPSLHRASRILRSSTVPVNSTNVDNKENSDSSGVKCSPLRWSTPVNVADCSFMGESERTVFDKKADTGVPANFGKSKSDGGSVSTSNSSPVKTNIASVNALSSAPVNTQCDKLKHSELSKKTDCFQSSTKLKRSESLNKSSDRSDSILNLKLRRSESLNKNDRAEINLNVKLRRSESLNKNERGDSKLKRSDSLTKTEKTESNMNRRRQQENRANARGNCGGSTNIRDKETTKMFIQNATIVLTKLKRKNGMPERSIKRRHTVGGTKDFDKIHWLDNRLQSDQWESNNTSVGLKEKKSLRTSSPDLSSSRLAGILVEVSLLHSGDVHRPHSLPDPNLVSAVFKVPLESHV